MQPFERGNFGSIESPSKKRVQTPSKKFHQIHVPRRTEDILTCENKVESIEPMQVLRDRMDEINRRELSEMDYTDLKNETIVFENGKRQFAPQYS